MSPTRSQPRRPGFADVAQGAIVVLIAALPRFFRLDSGLRHEPDYDERVFVENALGMISRGDWDHHFYEYPGLLLWILRVVLSFTGARGPEAYFAARVVIALASALTIGLVFVAVSAWVSRRAAWIAALVLALSTLDIETAHMFRPDVVIAPLLLAALALTAPRAGDPKEAWGWAVAAIATAIKFSAALVFAPLVLISLCRRAKLARLAGLSLMALGLFVLLSPYTFLSGASSLTGMKTQLSYHYESGPTAGFFAMLGGFLGDTLPQALSIPGLLLCVWGAMTSLRAQPRWTAAWLAFPVLWILIFSTTGARYGRFMVPLLGVLCVFIALGFEDLRARSRLAALAAAAVSLGSLALASERYLADQGALTMDQALDWVQQAPGIEAVGSSILDLGAFNSSGREVVPLRGFRGEPVVASQFDALVMPGAATAPVGFALAARFLPESARRGPDIAVFRALVPRRFTALDLSAAVIHSSVPDRDAALIDGVVSTRWRSADGAAFIEITWSHPVLPSRLEIAFGAIAPERELGISLLDEIGAVEAHSVRPPMERQRPGTLGFSQVLAWSGRSTRRLRIDLKGTLPLRISELRVFTQGSDGAPPPH